MREETIVNMGADQLRLEDDVFELSVANFVVFQGSSRLGQASQQCAKCAANCEKAAHPYSRPGVKSQEQKYQHDRQRYPNCGVVPLHLRIRAQKASSRVSW
jgi:hypothetical protein